MGGNESREFRRFPKGTNITQNANPTNWTQIRCKSDANPMQIPCTSLCQAHTALLNSCRGVLPLCYRNQFGSSPPPHALLLLSALLESVLAMRIKQKKRGRGRGRGGEEEDAEEEEEEQSEARKRFTTNPIQPDSGWIEW